MYVAFMYDNYYCWSPKSNFKGCYEDIEDALEDALEELKGGRYENQNLELMHTETFEFRTYEWIPYYKEFDIRNEDGSSSMDKLLQIYYDKEAEKIKIEWDGDTRQYGFYGNALYNSGYWKQTT